MNHRPSVDGIRTAAAIRYFGSVTRLARALGINRPHIYRWGMFVPALRQLQLDWMTRGALQADPALKPPRVRGVEPAIKQRHGPASQFRGVVRRAMRPW